MPHRSVVLGGVPPSTPSRRELGRGTRGGLVLSGPHPELSHLGPLVGFVERGDVVFVKVPDGMDAGWPAVWTWLIARFLGPSQAWARFHPAQVNWCHVGKTALPVDSVGYRGRPRTFWALWARPRRPQPSAYTPLGSWGSCLHRLRQEGELSQTRPGQSCFKAGERESTSVNLAKTGRLCPSLRDGARAGPPRAPPAVSPAPGSVALVPPSALSPRQA